MDVRTAASLVQSAFEHGYVKHCYQKADERSGNQTKHDINHAHEVRVQAGKVVKLIEEVNPGFVDEWTKLIVIELAAFLHDIGRCIDVSQHATAGQRWAIDFLRHYLKTPDGEVLPESTIERVGGIIASHRSSVYIKSNSDDPALHIVLLADKCVGDQERVRWRPACLIRLCSLIRRPLWSDRLRNNGIHDRINFGIKKSVVERDDRTLVLRLEVDTRVCQPNEILGLFAERYHCCALAANKLGFGFVIECNGVRV